VGATLRRRESVTQADETRCILREISSDIEHKTHLMIALAGLVGDKEEDVLWFADVLASRSSGHRVRVDAIARRACTAVRETRGNRRIEQHLAALGAEYSPRDGWEKHVLDRSRAQERGAQPPQLSASIWRRLLEWLRRS